LQYAIAALDMPSVTYRVSEMESDPVGLARPR